MANCNECPKSRVESVPYIVYEASEARHERRERRHWIVHIVSIAAIVLVVVGFLIYLNQYDFESYSYEQDGEGINIIGDRNSGVDNYVATPFDSEED